MCVHLLCWLDLEVWLMMEQIPSENYRCFFPVFCWVPPSLFLSLSLFPSACCSLISWLLNGKSPSYCRKCCPVHLHSQTKKSQTAEFSRKQLLYFTAAPFRFAAPLITQPSPTLSLAFITKISKSMVSPLDESEVADMVRGGKQKIEDNTGIREVGREGGKWDRG